MGTGLIHYGPNRIVGRGLNYPEDHLDLNTVRNKWHELWVAVGAFNIIRFAHERRGRGDRARSGNLYECILELEIIDILMSDRSSL